MLVGEGGGGVSVAVGETVGLTLVSVPVSAAGLTGVGLTGVGAQAASRSSRKVEEKRMR